MATQMMDIGLDDEYDLLMVDGDFTVEESTARHQEQMILNNKGDYKQNPTVGVGVFDYLDDENFRELARAISVEFTRDGMNVKSVQLSRNGIINTDAFYK